MRYSERAIAPDCMSDRDVHGTRPEKLVVKPWGERSFYAEDKWKNPLCFVEEGNDLSGLTLLVTRAPVVRSRVT